MNYYRNPHTADANLKYGKWVIPEYFDIVQRRPFYKEDTPSLSVTEAIDLRARELIDTGQHLQLLWSGGVDSTLAAAALIRNEAKDWSVLTTVDGIEEYPEFYERFLKTRATVMPIGTYFNSFYKGLTLYGEYEFEMHNKSGDQGRYWNCMPWYKHLRKEVCEVLEREIELCPKPIKTQLDMAKWLGEYRTRCVFELQYNTRKSWDSGTTIPFLDSMPLDKITLEDDYYWEYRPGYKLVSKDYISLVFKDTNYYKNKGNRGSLQGRAIPLKDYPDIITTDNEWIFESTK